MDFVASIAGYSLLAFAFVLLVSQLAAHEIGYRIGVRGKERSAQGENVGAVVAGMLGLLAFVLALTLSYSTARFGERRQGALTEANAIGTAWLRATTIDTPQAAEIAKRLEDYLTAREDFVRAGRNPEAIAKANTVSSDLQAAIWKDVIATVRERPDAISASLMSSINEMFDASTSEQFAQRTQLPSQIFWLLVGAMLLSMASLGYQFGLKGKPVRVMILLLTLVWTATILNILDLASSRLGNFRTDTIAYDWTRQSFERMKTGGTAGN